MSARKSAKNKRRRAGRFDPGALTALALALAAALSLGFASSRAIPASGAASVALRISEVMAANGASLVAEDGSMPDWVELENASDRPLELSGWALLTQSRPSRAFALPGGQLQPGERVVIYCDEGKGGANDGQCHAPFRLSAAGETLVLLNPHGLEQDSVTTPALSEDQVYCRDEAGSWAISDFPTPGAENRADRVAVGDAAPDVDIVPGALEITEVMSRNATFFPDENGACHDCVEIHNTTGAPVALEGWCLSDSRSDLGKWAFPALSLPADGYLAIHCSGEDRTDDPAHLHADFRLSGDGEDVFLTDPAGVTVSHVKVPALEADGSCCLAEGGWSTALSPSPGRANDQAGADAAADEIARRNPCGVFITELLASSNKSADWIEIHNAESQAVDLSGFGLSDNASRPRKWQFPAGTVIQPGAYIGIFADGRDGLSDGNLHAGFSLSAQGGYSVTLSDPQGGILDRVYVLKQYQNISYGRPESLTGVRYFETPSPGAPNTGAAYYGRAPQPVFSVRGGLYTSPETLSVELSAPSDCRIYYTLDCTDPTQSSPLYTGPIPVSGTTVLRARVFREGCMPSFMEAESYLYDVNNGDGTIYVASLVSDPYNLTSDAYGIMAKGPNALPEYPHGSLGKGANFWMDWEREAHIEVFAPDGATLISQECGTKLHGQSGRARDQKSLKVIARNRYGSNRFQAALFTRRPYAQYQSFVLRSCSQDGSSTRMRDAMLQQIAAGTGVMYQEYEIGILYLNGEFWGHYNLRENINANSICQFEGWEGEEDDIDFIKQNSTVVQGSNETMAGLLDWINAHSRELDTDLAYDTLDSAIDIENYLRYMAMEVYLGNTDAANIKRYRNGNRDGKWRWILYDLDMAFREDTNSVRRWLQPGGMGAGKNTDNTLFIACIKNSRIRARYLAILGEMMATTCSAENIRGMAEQFYNRMLPILPDQFRRWNQDAAKYASELKKLVSYAEKRPGRMLQFLKGCEELHLTRDEMELWFGDVMRQLGVGYDDIEAY